MCGFIGLITNLREQSPAFEQGLEAILDRGITVDYHVDGGEHYGYVRLPTDDVGNNSLGMIHRGVGKLLFNGLITNVPYLVDTLNLPAAAIGSDTLCFQSGLEKHGVEFLRRAKGMFAAAYVSSTSITLIRDTIGIKPLYYALDESVFAFASELKALAPLALTALEVPPGTILTFDKTTRRLSSRNFEFASYERYFPEQLEDCLRNAVVTPTVRYLNNSPNNIALLLSGGIDSSINAALLAQALPESYRRRVAAFCIGDDESADVLAAQHVTAKLGLKLTHVRPYAPDTSLQLLSQMVYKTESPHARVIKVALLYDALAEAMQTQGIQVVVGGEGADELFFGYHRFIDGLTTDQSALLFDSFFRKIFHYTLLQRYDRIMAQRQIEGRVPYLDQEVVALANRIPPAGKIQHNGEEHISKLPLRALGRQLGLPDAICTRPKEKMTSGATGKPNSTSRGGYLEQECIEATGMSFESLVKSHYHRHFGDKLKTRHYTEEQALEQVAFYKAQNNKSERVAA